MKFSIRFLALPLLAALLAAAGCESVSSRIKEKPDVYASLDPATQNKIKQGIIDIGYSEDMVYLALGKPDERHEQVNQAGRQVTWIYNTYYERYDGTHFAGYYRQVYFDPVLHTYRVYYHPAYADAYTEEKEARIQVTFKDGRTTAIEQSAG
ncbi:MAG TPA: hypothetical protein VFJ90_13155 [Candidatus Didemnitutus sp.]|nr:hypothetical protein [Candidatus Didemnitutus sp.]